MAFANFYRISMAEVADAGEDHGQAEFVGVSLSLSLLTVVLIVVIARILLVGLRAELMEVRAVFRLLGQSLRIDVHDGGTDELGDSHKVVGRCGIGDDLERSRVAAALTLLTVDSVSGKRSGHDGGGDGGKQHESRSETA